MSFPRINIEYLCSEILVLKLRLNSVARTESLLRGDSFIALGREGEMKTRYNQMRRSLLVFSGFFLALLSEFPHLYAEDQGTDRAVIEAKDKNIKINEQPMEPDNTRSTVHLVGPSGEEIHIFFMRRPIIAIAIPAN